MTDLTRRTMLVGGLAMTAAAATRSEASTVPSGKQSSFRPGQVWVDTAGKPIQAHGGSMIVIGRRFYWYGENKEFTTGKNRVWTTGVRCYVSEDLYNWEDIGLIIPPQPNDPRSPLNPEAVKLDRPHIIYNKASRKFVCWLKIMDGSVQNRTVLVADRITGPWSIVATGLSPLGMNAGDFDLAVADDGKAYMYFDRVHSEIICADLNESYTGVTGYYSTHFPHATAPAAREGPAYFRRGGKHYLATSGLTGYYPNPTEIAEAETFHGPFKVLGNLHPADKSRSSFNSQISCIFKHPAKQDLYIAMADRWNGPITGADFESGRQFDLIESGLTKATNPLPPRQSMTAAEKAVLPNVVREVNTSQARYVWLPLRFEDERPIIDWHDEWRWENYA